MTGTLKTTLLFIGIIACCCSTFFENYINKDLEGEVEEKFDPDYFKDEDVDEEIEDNAEYFTDEMMLDAWRRGRKFQFTRISRMIRRPGTNCKPRLKRSCRKSCNLYLGCYDVCSYRWEKFCF